RRFEQFRCLVPSTLPERVASDRNAGVQLLPQTPISIDVYDKSNPEEGVFPFFGPEPFGFDMIEANVSGKILDVAGVNQVVSADSGPVAMLGIDLSTNRDTQGIADQGATGTGGPATFSVTNAGWATGAFTGFFLIDSQYEQFQIVSNTSNRLNLDAPTNASGTPRNGAWIIARDPTFLEQIIVEFYDNGNDGGFNHLDDLMPMDIDPTVSGIALYRDNDNNPSNENGTFDDGDLPVRMNFPPYQIGAAGEVENQFLLVFSTPGTDDIPTDQINQTRRRQWIPDSFGNGLGDPNAGPDFFVVIQTSNDIQIGDDFRVGMASWGPNTPTEPDPDTFPPPPATRTGEFDVFSEFPWGQRAIGLITFFQDETYFKQYPEEDNSGFNWVRSSINKSVQTGVILAGDDVSNPDDLIIDDVSPNVLPKNITGAGFTLTITGENFGSSPTVTLDGVSLTVVTSSETLITALIPGGTTLDTDGDGEVTLRVDDPSTGNFDRFSDFEIDTTGTGGGNAPVIISITPDEGNRDVFPVTITGENFSNEPVVRFEGVLMPIQGTPTSTEVRVSFPVGGLPFTGPLDVQVRNKKGLLGVKPNGFNYINSPTGGGDGGGGFGGGGGLPTGGCFIATAAYGSPFSAHLDTFRSFRDGILLKTAPGTALVNVYYTVSPSLADDVAGSPVLSFFVRAVLTPVAWAMEAPGMAAITMMLVMCGGLGWRARRVRARATVR
ncbi:MAG: CFI-box-CTERM domain-containing protein, partial [Candidatus Hydrogenedentes bacterium]|nr:CFI-box-CTERM domain-containing protein [Candidatus Hydrogenedentota bacterium]